ncbi:MAG: IS110 family transposase [Proteobacteria bacterium]|nr:IS110 family transposase [Pseudomonadota bacterium]
MSHTQAAAIRTHDGAICVSLELSCSQWLVASLSPGSEKMSKHRLEAGDGPGLLALLQRLRAHAEKACGEAMRLITIQEAGLDGFWLDRLLKAHGIESHVVDAASIAVSRRARRAKSDKIDVEALLRTLLAWLRGEPRVCSMVRPPSAEEEDRRRLTRERQSLIKERTRLSNRIRGLLASQGICLYDPLKRDRHKRLQRLQTGDGRAMPARLKSEIERMLERLEILMTQIKKLEAERAEQVAQNQTAALLLRLKGIGPEFAATLWLEGFYRDFANRRQLAAYAGLAPTPWQSGSLRREQGISKAGNPRLRRTMIELAWLWLRHQPQSQFSRWFVERVGQARGRVRRIAIVALARKLVVALWHYVGEGLVPEGAQLKTT